MQYAAVGPFDINIFNHYYSSTKDQFNSFGFEGVGTVTHVGKEVDSKAFIGKKLAFMKVDAIAQAYSEYAIVPVGSTIFIDEKTLKNEQLLKERAYLIGSPFTAKGLLEEVLLTHNHKSIVMDTANSSLGQIVARLCDKHSIQLINIVRSEQGVKTMESISKGFVNINTSENDYLNKFKDAVKDRNPSLYVTFQGGNLPSRIFELMPKAFIGKKLAFMKVDAIAQAYSEYAIVPVGSTILMDEKTLKNEQLLKERAYLIGNPFTAKGFLNEVLLTQNHKSIVMDTANSSFGQIVARLCDKHNIQLINIVRSEQGVKTMESISKSFININTSENEYLNKLKDSVKDRNPSLYVTFQGGNLPSRIFELMPYRTSMVTLGVINNEKISGFSTVPFIFHEKKIFGYSISPYMSNLISSNKTNEVGQELLKDPDYAMSFDFTEFKLSEFEKAVEFQKT
eukprot:CAMPEP_0170536878 /NCGR_PEP_ID=MMETSP0209-20121228/102394_1 /TAXON_ID=665100 ORGANISM="Litonotus pictus, Strain P1" /NCGR_SAMPLE_ID=MMETSP0209 /ASSEMBLY_ACC=CAM_ASM_000301 /LENGTH=452 /DNA_ID=CAMNT_0010838293 /DNA_START=594 /DNA_END=1950 /DNA_ORIENTATION=-